MKVVAVLGSYRSNGVTEQAAAAVLEGARQEGAGVETIRLADREIQFCRNCRACTQANGNELGACPIEDDMRPILQACAGADIIVLAAPINMGSTTAIMKRFIERLVPTAFWPWGQPAPRIRDWVEDRRIAAVLLTSSAAPSLLARLSGFSGLSDLRWAARAFRARVVARRWYGLCGQHDRPALGARQRAEALNLGGRVVRDQRARTQIV